MEGDMGWAGRQRRLLEPGDKHRLVLRGALMAALMGTPVPSHAQTSYPLSQAGNGLGQPTPSPAAQLKSLRGGFREFATDGLTRVIGGQPTSRTVWRNFVLVRSQTPSGRTSTCGGTVIGRQWVLTAGHCVVGKSAADFTVIEDIDDLKEDGRKIPVDRIVLHEGYSDGPPRNDIALVHLASRAQAPGQALMSNNLARVTLRAGSNATLAGFGLTTTQPLAGPHTGSISDHLLQVSLPIVERSACARILAQVFQLSPAQAHFLDDSTVCAGEPAQGGRDACNGDSGGPLAVDVNHRQVQAGVVSWGPGCGLRDTVGVYTSVGYFEDWIRRSAPDAVFVARDEESPPPPPVVPVQPVPIGAEPCGLPPVPADAGVRLDVAEGARVRIGAAIHVRATPAVAGQLLVFNIDTQTCRTYQLFPNQFSSGARVGSVIAGGATVSIPGATDTFVIRVGAPIGKNRLYAMIVPAGISINDLASRGVDMRTLVDAPSLWRELSSRVRTARDGAPPVEAVGMFSYEIVP
jgi:Trypsin/Domain of unknown function (DUF4384)